MRKKSLIGYGSIVFLIILTLIILPQKAYADIIFTPEGDNFYDKHQNECEIVARSYVMNGKEGSVKLFESPLSKKVVTKLPNETVAFISVSFEDKNEVLWGSVEIFNQLGENRENVHGWVKMKELQLVYDNEAFCEEHKKEFKKYNGEFDHYEIKDLIKDQIVLWEYPGSANTHGKLNKLDPLHKIACIYEDVNKRVWGYYVYADGNTVGYGNKSGVWICISDPTNLHLPALDYNQPTIIPPNKDVLGHEVKVDHTSTILLIALPIVVLVFISGLLIRLFWKKNE